MRMTSGEALKRKEALLQVENKILPFKLSYAIGRNLNNLEAEAKIIEEEREKICAEFAAKDKNGNPMTKIVKGKPNYVFENDDDYRNVTNAYSDLLKIETDINIFMASLGDIEQCEEMDKYSKLTVKDQREIMFMIEEEK